VLRSASAFLAGGWQAFQKAEWRENSGFILRQAQDEVERFQRLNPHGEPVAVRRAHREAMGRIVFKQSASFV
jgi:hypothetical protein